MASMVSRYLIKEPLLNTMADNELTCGALFYSFPVQNIKVQLS